MIEKSFYLVSLGCAKNTVDSESMASLLINAGYQPVEKPGQAGLLIVNTCGFIKPARDESIFELRKLAHKKRSGQFLIAAGCLTERYREEVAAQVPGIDGMIGTRRWMDIVDVVQQLRTTQPKTLYHLPDTPTVGTDEHGVLRVSRQGPSAYLKIADGCRRPCAYCSIPLIKGTAVSRPVDAIVREAKLLQDAGVKELILIAQDTTDYGHDLGMKDGLATLIEQITSAAPKLPWLRILYAYPGYVTDRLIDLMANTPQVLHYLDMPLQHAHPETLKRMRRPANVDWVHRTLGKMRQAMPDLALRTTFIVGYPGESEEEFQTLLDFISDTKFDRVGVFPFSFEPGTTSEPLGDPIPKELKEERVARVMQLQETISLTRNQALVGKKLPVLIEGIQKGVAVGRSYRDAPEIDGMVFAEGKAELGQIVPVLISGALVHDLTGSVIPTSE
ncbi:MAG TPA: 30S ribosomal protein S12 methylthiotransferase RimO [Longilinea sp.]|nr:30S ribosomal protein S12 methylthiotransferase RimO [Longilinea sp.]